MKIESGSTRAVLLLGWFVLKFPIFAKPDWHSVRFIFKMGLHKYVLRNKNFEPDISYFNFFESLTAVMTPFTDGVFSNWLEFYYYLKTRNDFLVPTYFSFFGLVNVQKQIVKIKIRDEGLIYPFEEFFSIIDDYHRPSSFKLLLPFCHHMLKESYCWGDDGGLMMFDYGNKSVFPFICEKGEEMHRRFCKSS
jgi:hypothetical protein